MLPAIPLPASTPERVLLLLEAIAAQPDGLSFGELRNRLGNAPSTMLTRALEPLMAHLFVDKDPVSGRYLPGERLMAMARSVSGQSTLEERFEPIVRRLADETGHSAAYFHWDAHWAYVRIKAEVAESFHYAAIGHRSHPITHTFLRPILAYLPLKRLEQMNHDFPISERERIRKEGFDSQQERLRSQIYRITAPVFAGVNGPVIGALGITSLQITFSSREKAQLIEQVKATAAAVTTRAANLPDSQL